MTPSFDRRKLLAALASTTLSPIAARAQRMPRLGLLLGEAQDASGLAQDAAITQGLAAFNWKAGETIRIDRRWALGDPALAERYADELVALEPDVLLVQTTPCVEALRRRTKTIPIVFVVVTDPVAQGFVESLARPGGNITGFTDYDPPMAGKWLRMLTEITPPAARAAVLYNPETAPFAGLMQRAILDAASALKMEVRAAPVSDDAGIDALVATLAREDRGGLLVLPDVFGATHRETILAATARHRVPAVYPFRPYVTRGGLMSYGVDIVDVCRRGAAYVDRILKGEKPSDLPVQAPTKYSLVVNQKTAKALGVVVSATLLTLADEVIE